MDENRNINEIKAGTDGRADRLLGLAQTLRKDGASQNTIEAALIAENAAKYTPKLGDAEVLAIARYIPVPDVTKPTGNGTERSCLDLQSLCELLAKPIVPVDWVWGNRLAAGTLGLIVSKPKVGKSTIARNLALAVARNEPFLGEAVTGGTVLYLALEERVEDLTADFRAMGATSADNIVIAQAGNVNKVIASLEALKPRLLIVDPLIRLLEVRDQNSYSEIYSAMGPMLDVARKTGTHILNLHHSPKSAREDSIDSPLGSTAIAAVASTVFTMVRTGNTRSIVSIQRLGQDLPETYLSFDASSKTLALGNSRKVIAAQSVEGQILSSLKGGALTEPEIVDAVSGNTKLFRKVLRAMTETGVIVRTGSGKKGDPHRYALP
jgi:hypothetical protein